MTFFVNLLYSLNSFLFFSFLCTLYSVLCTLSSFLFPLSSFLLLECQLDRSSAPGVYLAFFGGQLRAVGHRSDRDVEGGYLLHTTFGGERVGDDVEQETSLLTGCARECELTLVAALFGGYGEVCTHLGDDLARGREADTLTLGVQSTTLQLDVVTPPLFVRAL